MLAYGEKIGSRLIKSMMSDKEDYEVDIFFSDNVKDRLYKRDDKFLHTNATFTRNLETNETTYTLNDQVSDPYAISQYTYEQKIVIAEKQRMRNEKRVQNIAKVAKAIGGDKMKSFSEVDSEYVSLKLSKSELERVIKKSGDAVHSIDVHTKFDLSFTLNDWVAVRDGYMRGVSITQMHDPNRWGPTFPKTYGEGMRIYYSDAGCMSSSDDIFDGYNVADISYQEIGTSSAPNVASHTRVVSGILQHVAPKADQYCNDTASSISARLPGSEHIPEIKVETYSVNYYDGSNVYENTDRAFDHHAYENRTIPVFVAAGNWKTSNTNPNLHKNKELYVLTPAKAFNIITVGMYRRNGPGDQSVHERSGYVDPITPISGLTISNKPEITAPGFSFYDPTALENPNTGSEENATSGTSYATPWSAAVAADIMSQGEYFQNSSAMIKAIMIAGASDPVSGGTAKVGEGGVDLFTSTWQVTNTAYWYDYLPHRPFEGTNPNQFDYNDECFTNWKTTLYGNRQQRIVISWLNDVDSASTLSNVPNRYKMELLNSAGTPILTANADTRGYQLINTQLDGTYRVRVCIERQDANQRFDIGFAVSQRYEDDSVWDQ